MRSVLKIVLLLFVLQANAQFPVFIGMSKDDILKEMETKYKQFSQNTDFKNSKFKYMKFIDRTGDETLLVFLSDDEKCTLTKLMTGYDNEPDRVAQLSTYKKTEKDKWETTVNDRLLLVELKREEWYLTFIVKQKN
jgi:hypothetical protein